MILGSLAFIGKQCFIKTLLYQYLVDDGRKTLYKYKGGCPVSRCEHELGLQALGITGRKEARRSPVFSNKGGSL